MNRLLMPKKMLQNNWPSWNEQKLMPKMLQNNWPSWYEQNTDTQEDVTE